MTCTGPWDEMNTQGALDWIRQQRASADRRDFDRTVMAHNRRGELVPSIPLPFFGTRKQCTCGAKFWTMKGYKGHYAYEHVLGGD